MELLKIATFILFCLAVWIGSPQSDVSKSTNIPNNAEENTTNTKEVIVDLQTKD